MDGQFLTLKSRYRRKVSFFLIDLILVLLTLAFIASAIIINRTNASSAQYAFALLAVPITVIYTFNHISGHLFWMKDNWNHESRKHRESGSVCQFISWSRSQRLCLYFLLSDIPLAWATVEVCVVSYRWLFNQTMDETSTLLWGVVVNVLYTFNNVTCHLTWLLQNWTRLRAFRAEQHPNSVHVRKYLGLSRLHLWSLGTFVVPDILLLLPLTLVFWYGVLCQAYGQRIENYIIVFSSTGLNAMYTFQNAYGHYCSFAHRQ